MLIAIKLLHTAIWAALAGCIVALPFLALARRFGAAWVITEIVIVECAILALNGGRCPLTDWAARYTTARADNFDIYLPLWLARYNKMIFGTLFLAGESIVAACWLRRPGMRSGMLLPMREQSREPLAQALCKTKSNSR